MAEIVQASQVNDMSESEQSHRPNLSPIWYYQVHEAISTPRWEDRRKRFVEPT